MAEDFRYSITFTRAVDQDLETSGVVAYHSSVRWFISKFGWSHNKSTREVLKESPIEESDTSHYKLNPHWAYELGYDKYRIFTNDEELVFFQLSQSHY